MRRVEFLKIEIENFRSWESLELSLAGRGAVLITGRNGVGKSNLFMALLWALFGRTFQQIAPKALIRRGAKKCRVSVAFRNPAGQLIKLRRERLGQHERIVLDDGTDLKEMGPREASLWLPRVLGMGWKAFTQLVFVGGMNRFFLQLQDGEKKELLEELLRLQRFAPCAEKASLRLRELEGRRDSLRARAGALQASLKQLEQEIVKAQGQGVAELEKRMDKLRQKIQALESDLGHEGSLEELEETLNRALEELEKHKSLFSKLSFQASALDSQIARIESLGGRTCSECGRDLSRQEARELVRQKRGRGEKLEEILVPLREKIAGLKRGLQEIHAHVSRIAELARRREELLKELEAAREERERVSLGYRELLDRQRHYYQKELGFLQSQQARIAEIKPYFEFWVSGFGKKGIRADYLKRFSPWLTEYSNRYLAYLSDRFCLEFGLDCGEFISRIRCQGLGEMKYPELSAGERRRLDLAVSLALRDVAEQAVGIGINLTALDELVETLDADGAQRFADLVKVLSVDRTSFVISHNDLLEGCFDSVWEVSKKAGVSSLVT